MRAQNFLRRARTRLGATSRRTRIAALIAAVLLAVLVTLFLPGVQKSLVVKYAGPSFERLEFERIHILPWSVTLERFDVDYDGLEISGDTFLARFCLTSLLGRTVNLKELTLLGAAVDLTRFSPPPSPPPTAPFPGVFASLDLGFDFALGSATIVGDITVTPTERLHIEIDGGGIEPDATGALAFRGRLDMPESDRVAFTGALTIDQRDHGRFNEIAVRVDTEAALAALPEPEHARLRVVLKPTADPTRREIEVEDGDNRFEPEPESIALELLVHDGNDAKRADFALDAMYNGLAGTLAGQYTLNTNDGLAKPYLAGQPAPGFSQSGGGDLMLDIFTGAVELTLDSRTAVTDLKRILGKGSSLPAQLNVVQRIAASANADSVVIDKLDLQVLDDQSNTVLATALVEPMDVAIADPLAALAAERRILTLELGGISLGWFDGNVPDIVMHGVLAETRFELASDADGAVHFVPLAPLVIDGIQVEQGESLLADGLVLSLSPRIDWSDAGLEFAIPDVAATAADVPLAHVRLHANLPKPAADAAPTLNMMISGDVQVDPVLAQPGVAPLLTDVSLPESLSLSFDGAATQSGNTIRISNVHAKFSQPDKEELILVDGKQAFTFRTGTEGEPITNPTGDLAAVVVSDLDLGWLSPFAEPYVIDGRVAKAEFTLRSDGKDKLSLSANAPLRLAGLTVTEGDKPLLRNVWATLSPTIEYSPEQTSLRYEGLRISGGSHYIAGGSGAVVLTPREEIAPQISAEGRLDIDLNALAEQPVVAGAMPAREVTTPLATNFTYRVNHDGEEIRVERIDLDLSIANERYIGLESRSGLNIRPAIEQGDNLAKHAIGEIQLAIEALSGAALADLLGPGFSFDRIDGVLRLSSDGERLVARSDEALIVHDVQLKDADGKALLHPFDLRTEATVEATGQTVDATLETLALTFAGKENAALSGKLSASIEPGRTIPLRRLATELAGDVPQLLDQPAVLPGHALTSGSLASKVAVDPDGNITARTVLDALASREPLAITTIELPLTGNMRPDGKGFEFTMPLIGTGKSGTSDAVITGSYLPVPGEPASLGIDVQSKLFYLNDILATVDGISARPPSKKPETKETRDPKAPKPKAVPIVLDETADTAAFWDVLPYNATIGFAFDQMFYSDYLAFNAIQGRANLTADKLLLNDFSAKFHDSPLTLDGGLTFTKAEPEPYTAKLRGKVEDFDLNQFFTELTPNEESRIEGLFGVDIAVDGTSPNAAQFRNRLLLDFKMNSRDGLFRPLPSDGVLMASASGALGIVGEGLSYLPTGGFGAGAVSRLVNYIAEIDYDTIDIHVVRDTSLDLVLKRFNMLSPTIRMSAKGKISHEPGRDIIDSPLDLVAHLNMTGKGAAILYSLDLIKDEQDKYGYWKGPEFNVSGSVAESESNLADIIQQASDGALKGGITRPFAGFIGNVKHRWFGHEGESGAAATDDTEQTAPAAPPVAPN